ARPRVGPVHQTAGNIESDTGRASHVLDEDLSSGAVEVGPRNVATPLVGPVHLAARNIKSDSIRARQSAHESRLASAVEVGPPDVPAKKIGPVHLAAGKMRSLSGIGRTVRCCFGFPRRPIIIACGTSVPSWHSVPMAS